VANRRDNPCAPKAIFPFDKGNAIYYPALKELKKYLNIQISRSYKTTLKLF
jgi:hypothetical protein